MQERIQSSKIAEAAKKKEEDRYPGCNIEYVKENQKSKIWCTTLRLVLWVLLPKQHSFLRFI